LRALRGEIFVTLFGFGFEYVPHEMAARFIASPDKQIPYSSSPLGEREEGEGEGGEGPAAAEVAKQNVESPESSVTNFRITERLRTASSRLGNSPANSRLGRGLKVKLAGRLAESRSFPFPDWRFRPQAGCWSSRRLSRIAGYLSWTCGSRHSGATAKIFVQSPCTKTIGELQR